MKTATCIVGLVHCGTVYIGSDSASISGYYIQVTSFSKCFTIGSGNSKMIIGYTTSFRMGQILEYEVTPPEFPFGMDVMKYLVTMFIPECRRMFSLHWKETDAGKEVTGGTFLLGFRGRLFCIDDDMHVNESSDEYSSVGCGRDLALGSLFATKSMPKMKPKARVINALSAAAKFSMGVCEPFNIVKL